jgi:hypothetical protein
MADRQVQGLRRRRKKVYEDFLDDLEQRGCAALDYRLTGPAPIDSICIKHLWGQDRAVVTFRTPGEAWILLVAPHNDQDPEMDVYQELYRLAGQTTPTGKRTKPSCCDAGGQTPDLVRRPRCQSRSGRPAPRGGAFPTVSTRDLLGCTRLGSPGIFG